jgi:thioredoxin 1
LSVGQILKVCSLKSAYWKQFEYNCIKNHNIDIKNYNTSLVCMDLVLFNFVKIIKENIMALEITDANFEETVLKSDKPVLVDFWAAWCGPCRMVGPIIEEVSTEYADTALVGKMDVDANQEFAAKYGVRNIPTVLVFQNGEVVGRQVGVAPKNAYTDALDALLK